MVVFANVRVQKPEINLRPFDVISTSKGDATVINQMFRDSAMILPRRRLALLTGEFRNQDHSKYMAPDEDEKWNAMGEVSRSVLVHFSDWPLPKPWISRSNNLWESTMTDGAVPIKSCRQVSTRCTTWRWTSSARCCSSEQAEFERE